MEFAFTPEEEAFRRTLRQFAERHLLPNARRWDQGEPFPREEVRELARVGLLGLRVPASYGGMEASFVQCGIAAEEVARGDFNCTLFIQLHSIGAEALKMGDPQVQERWLPAIASGEAVLALALTEPEAGSDAARIRCRATRNGDDYILEGEKSSITFAGMADAAVVYARTGGEGARGVSAFLVPLDSPGVSRTVYRSLGERMSQRGSLFFSGVRVPATHRIGEEGQGFYQVMGAFDVNRPVIGLCALGAAEQSLEETAEYVKARHAFGRPLAKFEGVSFQLAEHWTRIEAARLLCYKALWLRDQGLPHTKEAAMAKWFALQASVDAIHACLLLHGHYGYSQDLPLEQRLRDVIGLEIGDGTPEIMKLVIVRETLGREFLPYR